MKAIINARIYDYVTYIENGYLLYDDKVVEVGDMKNYKDRGYDKVEDFKGDLLMPTFVCAHSHIYSIFARGLALPFNPKNFQDILDQMWWKLDAELDNKMTYYSAISAGSEFLLNGVTSVITQYHRALSKYVLFDLISVETVTDELKMEIDKNSG